MVHADLSFKGETLGGSGDLERPSDVKSLLHSLTNEIEHARVRQDNALQELERHISSLETAQANGTPIDWDQASADALAALYDHRSGSAMPGFSRMSPHAPAFAPADLQDVYQRMGDLEGEISRALQDLARRQDLDGMRAVEGQVRDLTQQLDTVKGQLARLEAVETLVRDIAWQVSDERLSKLAGQGGAVAEDLQTMAEHQDVRQEELRRFIEATISDWRDAEARAQETARDLSASRHDMLASLIESSIQERRAAEAQAMSVLDTLQDALVNVLDRIEALETSTKAGFAAHMPHPHMQDPVPMQAPMPVQAQPAVPHPDVIAAHEGWAQKPELAGAPRPTPQATQPPALKLSVDPAFAPKIEPVVSMPAASAAAESPQAQSRRDMLLEVHRAKLKAAAARGAEAQAAINAKAKSRKAMPTGRLPGGPTTLLAAALAIVVAINGGLLFFARSGSAPAPAVTIEPMASTAPRAIEAAPVAASPRETADIGHEAPPKVEILPPRNDAPAHAPEQPAQFGYGYYGNALEETQVPVEGPPTAPPRGMTVVAAPHTSTGDAMAQTFEDQVVAGLSGDLGVAASRSTPSDLLPEKAGRVDAALTVEEPSREQAKAEAQPEELASSKPQLDMPPITVGPQSLRLAAANGNAAAEFEVATRMAEGKGMPQDPKEALRWYQRSASRGFAQAQYRVGTFYERGLAAERDLPRAMVWYQRAAEQGNVKAMHNLAVLAAGGVNGNPDYKTALTWFTKAANYGLADSQYNLAVLYENGLGPSADRVVAYKWYSLAAKGGDKDAAERRDALKASLSANEVKAAEGLITSFRPEVADKLANEPLAAQEAWKKEASNQAD